MDADAECVALHPAQKQATQDTQVTSEGQAQSTQVDRGKERALKSWKIKVTNDQKGDSQNASTFRERQDGTCSVDPRAHGEPEHHARYHKVQSRIGRRAVRKFSERQEARGKHATSAGQGPDVPSVRAL